MKKIICLMVVLMILSPVVLLADKTVKDEDVSVTPKEKILTVPQHEMGIRVGMRKGMYCPYCGMMGKASMEMAQDGSVVVLIGNRLLKYNEELTLVKEVEIPMPEMLAKRCPMKEKMAEKNSAPVAAEPQEKIA